MSSEYNPLFTCQYKPNSQLQNEVQDQSSDQATQSKLSQKSTHQKIKIISTSSSIQPYQQTQEIPSLQTSAVNQGYNWTQNTQMKQDLKSNLNQTLFMTKVSTCKYCANQISENQILLPCLHIYHRECLKEIVISKIMDQQVVILCSCMIKIPQQLILNLINNEYQIRKIYFINQLCLAIENAPYQIRNILLKSNTQNLKSMLTELMIQNDTPQKNPQN